MMIMQVTIQDAAHKLGLAESTVKRRLRNGELEYHQVPSPQGFTWLVELPDDLCLEQESQPSGEERVLRELVDALRYQITGLEGQLGTKDRQIEQLHVLLQQAQASLPASCSTRPRWQIWRRALSARPGKFHWPTLKKFAAPRRFGDGGGRSGRIENQVPSRHV